MTLSCSRPRVGGAPAAPTGWRCRRKWEGLDRRPSANVGVPETPTLGTRVPLLRAQSDHGHVPPLVALGVWCGSSISPLPPQSQGPPRGPAEAPSPPRAAFQPAHLQENGRCCQGILRGTRNHCARLCPPWRWAHTSGLPGLGRPMPLLILGKHYAIQALLLSCPPGRAPRGPQPGQPGPASGLVSTVAQGLESPLASSLSCSVNFSKTSVDFLPCSRILECWGVLWVGGPRCRFCGSLPWLVGTAAPPAPRPPGSVDWPFQRPRGVGGRPTPFLAHR